jgi:Gpi18-like mannosyltransferase
MKESPPRLATRHLPPLAGGNLALACAVLLAVALALYAVLIPYRNLDIDTFILPWLHHIQDRGIAQSLAEDFYDYTPPHIYLLSLASRLQGLVPDLVAVKSIPILFLLLSACLVFLLVRQIRPASPTAVLAAVGFLFLPTVVMNGPFWGQADLLPASGLLAFMACILARRPAAAVVCFGVALAFKLQAIFLAPFLLLLVLRREILWRHLLAVPAVYLVAVLPAALAGRPLLDLLTIYVGQGAYYSRLSMNAPNPYHVLEQLTSFPYLAGVILGCSLAGLAGLSLAIGGARALRASKENDLLLALVSLALMPFLLPKMHDRYFFFADVFAYVAACVSPRLFWAAVGFQASSLLACSNFLFGFRSGPFVGAAINTLLVAGLLFELWRRRSGDRRSGSAEYSRADAH